jgi:hypothetical protein
MTRFDLAMKFIHDLQTELEHSIEERRHHPRLFAALSVQTGELSAALILNVKDQAVVGANEIYLEAVRVAVMALRLATEGDPAFPYNPAEVTANVD